MSVLAAVEAEEVVAAEFGQEGLPPAARSAGTAPRATAEGTTHEDGPPPATWALATHENGSASRLATSGTMPGKNAAKIGPITTKSVVKI